MHGRRDVHRWDSCVSIGADAVRRQSVVLLDAQYEHRPQQDVARLLSQVDIVILQQFDFKSRITADVLKPVYDKANTRDGYVSLEVSPDLANRSAPQFSMTQLLHGLLYSKPSASWRLESETTETAYAWMAQQSGGSQRRDVVQKKVAT